MVALSLHALTRVNNLKKVYYFRHVCFESAKWSRPPYTALARFLHGTILTCFRRQALRSSTYIVCFVGRSGPQVVALCICWGDSLDPRRCTKQERRHLTRSWPYARDLRGQGGRRAGHRLIGHCSAAMSQQSAKQNIK